MNICVVTNDMRLARFIILELEEAGYTATHGEITHSADLYICDLDCLETVPDNCIGFSLYEEKREKVSTFLQRPIDAKKLINAISKRFDFIPNSERLMQIEINKASREAKTELGKIRLSEKEIALLKALCKTPILSREDGAKIFGDADSNVVDVYIYYLRKKLAKIYNGNTVKSMRGKGYSLADSLDIKFI